MAKQTWEMNAGDSLWLDITPDESIDSVNSVWPGTWAGTWTAKETLDGPAINSGDLILFDGLAGRPNTPGKFRLEIGRKTENATPLPVGTYILSVEITNEDSVFRKEIAQDKLKVKAEGV